MPKIGYDSTGVGRIKSAVYAGTAQTPISHGDTVSGGSGFDWRTPLRQSLGLLGPAYDLRLTRGQEPVVQSTLRAIWLLVPDPLVEAHLELQQFSRILIRFLTTNPW